MMDRVAVLPRTTTAPSASARPASRDLTRELYEFDWMNHKGPDTACIPEPPYFMFQASVGETVKERQARMLREVRRACMACSMCELGRRGVTRDGKLFRDPHVFSNQNPSRFVVVGQNPGWNEVVKCEPFVGDAGATFDAELEANGLSRSDLYICNTVRCHTDNNAKPLQKHIDRCEPFLRIEMNLLRPLLVAALGAVAFDRLCPAVRFTDGLGTITQSEQYEVPVFGLFHPSPLNLKEEGMQRMFARQMRTFCRLVLALKQRHDIS